MKSIGQHNLDKHFVTVVPIINPRVRGYCRLPYPGHPKGCPNWKKRDICPPQAPPFDKLIDTSKPIYCIYYRFDLKSHTDKMLARHPDWSDRKLRCCLYWQNTARKQLRLKTESFLRDHPDYTILTCPEGNGVDVVATVKQIGIELQWPAVDYAYKIAMAVVIRNNTAI
ncbi:MAG: hypothetical protein GY839_02335 [candidate division Zixibacteria bacterium]|nr:hypothetical protein [candidate division Zixibacteria bacterium]